MNRAFQGPEGQAKLYWFIGLSLCFHILLGFGLYHIKPAHESRLDPEPVIVRLMPLPPVAPEVAPEASRPMPRVPRVHSDKTPDVIEAPAPPKAASPLPEASIAPPQSPADTGRPGDGPGMITRQPAIERLFDPGVIAEQAQGGLTPMKDTGITFDTKEMMLTGYMGLLRDKIEGTWVYPRKAAEAGVYGDLVIRFSIRRDGKLGSAKVLRTSGHALLDEAALKALKDAGPYWPLPEAYKDETLVVTGRFIYSLYGMYVR